MTAMPKSSSAEEILARFPTANIAALAPVTLVEHGPLAWLLHRHDYDAECLFWSDGRWLRLRGVVAFHRALLEARPDLNDWQPIVAAWKSITHDEPLVTRDDVTALADPRWYTFPISREAIEAWRPPTFDGKALEFDVEQFPHRAEMARVRVGFDHRVEVTRLPR